MRLDNITKYFPSGIARGESFVNREKEREQLRKNIIANRHMVLMAPRRYGKTSLVTQVASEINISFSMIDFLAVHDDESVRDVLYDKIGKLVGDLLPPVQQAKDKLLSIFSSMRPELTLNAFGQKLVLHAPNAPATNISDLLLKLDETAVHFNKRAVLFIDEMQQISFLKNAHSIEASIRHALERSKNITYCFSGSSRHLLKKMFGDSARPLYRHCHTLEIGRIAKAHYKSYLEKRALDRWGQALTKEVFLKIVDLPQEHPFYLNALCQCLWMEEAMPNVDQVEESWKEYVQSNRHIIGDDIIGLSLNQKKILVFLAKQPTKALYSSDFLVKIKLTQSSIRKAVDVLLEKDFIYQDASGYKLVDPAMEYYLANIL